MYTLTLGSKLKSKDAVTFPTHFISETSSSDIRIIWNVEKYILCEMGMKNVNWHKDKDYKVIIKV